MSTPAGIIGSRLTSGVGEAASFAGGVAIAPTLAPLLRALENSTWALHPDKPLDALVAAAVAAEQYSQLGAMETEAAQNGVNKTRFDLMYDVTLTAPGMGELLAMARRKTIAPSDFTHGLRKAKLETQWDSALTDLQNVYLSPDILAVMLQRSVIPNQGQLPGVAPATQGKVPVFPQVPIDAYKMAATFGWSPEQLDAQTHIQGLPPGMDLVARGVFRGIFDPGDFELAAEQSNRRVEWAPLEFDVYRQIPTAHDFVENHLRGYSSQQAMYTGSGLHGMSTGDTDILFQNAGRPLNIHEITTGLARGGTFQPQPGELTDPYQATVHESNIKPAYYDLAIANKYVYPSAFVLRGLAQSGDLGNTAAVQTVLEEIGWDPKFAAPVAKAWTGGTAATDPNVKKAETQLWTTTHAAYRDYGMPQTQAAQNLTAIGVSPTAQTQIFQLWDAERASYRHGLTVANINKAYNKGDINEATGQPWTKPEANAALVQLGYNPTEADQYLDIG